MRFKFCGDLDCPDWILPQIATASKLTSIKLKFITLEVINGIITGNLNWAKAIKLGSDGKLDEAEIKCCLAALEFLIKSSAKYHVDGETLANELQQLGLPKEHSISLCKCYVEKRDQLSKALHDRSLKVNEFESLEWSTVNEFENNRFKVKNQALAFTLKTKNRTSSEKFYASKEKVVLLLSELKQAQKIMDQLQE